MYKILYMFWYDMSEILIYIFLDFHREIPDLLISRLTIVSDEEFSHFFCCPNPLYHSVFHLR